MDSKSVKKGLFLVTTIGALLIPGQSAYATESKVQERLPGAGIEQVLNDCQESNADIQIEQYLVPSEKGEYLDMAFANVHSFLYIRSEPTKESEWVGKLYPGYAAKITGPIGEWTPIESGSVTGYVKTEYILTGNAAEEKAQEIVNSGNASDEANAEDIFTYAESREEEEARLKKEAEERARSGQAVVDYAKQFLGNPYVWGGTSLTNGADCSGFVQSVYKHFGVDLPRTSKAMRSAGREVSYSEVQPGDIICYEGHVGIYAGDGQIVNAANKRKGITMSSATNKSIITVRRLL